MGVCATLSTPDNAASGNTAYERPGNEASQSIAYQSTLDTDTAFTTVTREYPTSRSNVGEYFGSHRFSETSYVPSSTYFVHGGHSTAAASGVKATKRKFS